MTVSDLANNETINTAPKRANPSISEILKNTNRNTRPKAIRTSLECVNGNLQSLLKQLSLLYDNVMVSEERIYLSEQPDSRPLTGQYANRWRRSLEDDSVPFAELLSNKSYLRRRPVRVVCLMIVNRSIMISLACRAIAVDMLDFGEIGDGRRDKLIQVCGIANGLPIELQNKAWELTPDRYWRSWQAVVIESLCAANSALIECTNVISAINATRQPNSQKCGAS